MIQELLGGTVGGEERKNSINGGHLDGSSSLSTTSSDNNQNLRCPRCDSSNTKFCYYNNYNLTQPRHFCKTCRRYWTKGGALRNVPIGGGCRKNKSTSVSSSKTNVSKVKPALSEIGKSSYNNGFDQDLQSPNTITWVSGQNSHLLSSLLRTSHNPSPNQNSGIPRNECTMMGSYLSSESSLLAGSLNARNPDSLSQAHGGLYSCQRRYNQHNYPHYRHQQEQQSPQNTTFINELPNTDLQDLYQRIRSSVNYSDPSATLLNVGSTSSSILEPIPAIGGEPSFWNPVFSWPDLPATNGAFP